MLRTALLRSRSPIVMFAAVSARVFSLGSLLARGASTVIAAKRSTSPVSTVGSLPKLAAPIVPIDANDLARLHAERSDALTALAALRRAIRADFLLHRGDDTLWNALSVTERDLYETALQGENVAETSTEARLALI